MESSIPENFLLDCKIYRAFKLPLAFTTFSALLDSSFSTSKPSIPLLLFSVHVWVANNNHTRQYYPESLMPPEADRSWWWCLHFGFLKIKLHFQIVHNNPINISGNNTSVCQLKRKACHGLESRFCSTATVTVQHHRQMRKTSLSHKYFMNKSKKLWCIKGFVSDLIIQE